MTAAAAHPAKSPAVWGGTKPAAPRMLICLPHAGAGASTFGPMIRSAPPTLDVVALQAPGRENRIREDPHEEAAPLVEELTRAVAPLLTRPYAVFGHSVGTVVAFELVRALRAEGLPAPAHLYLSARGAAHLPVEHVDLRTKGDDFYVGLLRDLGGTPDAAFNQAFIDTILPGFRADLGIQMSYEFRYQPRLDLPMTAFHAVDDDRVDADCVAAWGLHTTGPFTFLQHDGHHFTAVQDPTVVLGEVAKTAEAWG